MKAKIRSVDKRRAEFESLYALYSREVWATAYSRWMDADSAMDVMQECFLRLWRHWETGETEIENPRAWLIRVARNLAEDTAKSAFHRNGTSAPQTMTDVRSAEPAPLDMMVRSEAFARIRTSMEQLPQADRELLTWRYALEYDATKIAEMLGVNTAAVHMRLSRARQRLAEQLQADGITAIP